MFVTGCQTREATPPPGMPPPKVEVTPVTQRDVPVTGTWVATLDGYTNAQIQPQVSGYVVKQDYREGSAVKKDDVLFEIDPRPFQAALDQAKGQLSQARGQLAQARGQLAQDEAQLGLAQINVKRDSPLAEARAIARSQLDTELQTQKTSEAAIQTAQAAIQTAQAAIESAQANVETAELNLGFTKVRSLIDGVAGIAAVQLGNLVGPQTVLTTVSQVNPIKANFPISEQEYMRFSSLSKGGGDWLRATNPVALHLTLASGAELPQTGHFVFTDRQVDPQTGTIRVVGAFANPGNVLRPGQFGRVSAVISVDRGALLVPQRAISELQGHYQAAVVGPDNKVSIRTVEVGLQQGEFWIVKSGLRPGERVVTEGLSKIGPGATVQPSEEKK